MHAAAGSGGCQVMQPVAGKRIEECSRRAAWTPQPACRVRQLWESSSDGSKTWTVVFDGLYARQQ